MKNRAFLSLIITLLLTALLLLPPEKVATPQGEDSTPHLPNISQQTTPSVNNQSTTFSINPQQTSPNASNTGTQVNFKSRIGKTVSAPNGEQIVLKKYSIATVPNDPFASQWWQSSYSVESAWDLPTTAKQTVLAIIDTGVALQHEEFANRYYENLGETGSVATEAPSLLNCTDQSLPLDASCNNIDDDVDGIVDNEAGAVSYENPSLLNCTDQSLPLDASCNRVDDDMNGYIDDVTGWDFVNNDPSPQAGQLNPDGTSVRHGSMVAGIAAATSDNSLGTAGIDSDTKILPLQAIDDDGYGDSLTVGNAIVYAANQGADVINISLGSADPDTYILAAVEYAYSKGSVVVAASGNDGCNCMIYPARYDITLSVGATDESGNRASFSSYGNTLDVIAPGVNITSSSFTNDFPVNSYGVGSGTSYAAPIVSGLLSKIKAQLPTASPTQLIALLTEQTAQNGTGTSYKTTEKGYGDVSFSNVVHRTITPKTFTQLYTFGSVTNGGLFNSTEFPVYTYACESGTVGTIPLFKATKSANNFFSINPIDIRKSAQSGYAVQQLFTACIAQPNDTFESIRLLQTAQEFTNISIKTLLKP